MTALLQFFRWVIQKVAAVAFIVVFAIAAYGAWLFLREIDIDVRHNEWVLELTGQRDHYRAALEDVKKRMVELDAERIVQEDRAKQAEKIIAQLKQLESTWDRLVGNPEQQKVNADRMRRMEAMRTEAREKAGELQHTLTRTRWEHDGLELALGKLDEKIAFADAHKNKIWHYVTQAWQRVEWWVYGLLALYFLGPTTSKLTMFYVLAPIVARGRPVRLADSMAALPTVEASRVSLETALWPGERLWVKERFLQASDEGLSRKTRFVLDWRIPLSCIASGLVELIEISNAHAGAEHRVTLSNQANPHIELTLVAVPEGGSLVLRPSFLAGVITTGESRLVIRRRWQLFRWQSWLTLQFRFFEFVGPCRLIVAGSRGVRAESLAEREGNAAPARRTNQDATIGFTPNLAYQPVRAETFWGYYRGMNPLFDDLFSGQGIFLCQEISTPGSTGAARRFWSNLWGGVLRVFGM